MSLASISIYFSSLGIFMPFLDWTWSYHCLTFFVLEIPPWVKWRPFRMHWPGCNIPVTVQLRHSWRIMTYSFLAFLRINQQTKVRHMGGLIIATSLLCDTADSHQKMNTVTTGVTTQMWFLWFFSSFSFLFFLQKLCNKLWQYWVKFSTKELFTEMIFIDFWY